MIPSSQPFTADLFNLLQDQRELDAIRGDGAVRIRSAVDRLVLRWSKTELPHCCTEEDRRMYQAKIIAINALAAALIGDHNMEITEEPAIGPIIQRQ